MTSWRDYARLVRLPNVFTAVGDVVMGYLITHATLSRGDAAPLALLIGAGCAIYLLGMVWNDLYDLFPDRRFRPDRPLPSRRVSLTAARRLAAALVVAALILAALAPIAAGQMNFEPPILALALIGCVWMYDAKVKRGSLGPLAMGMCRGLNVLLGMSLTVGSLHSTHGLVVLAMIVYVAGITLFARREAGASEPSTLSRAALLMLAPLAVVLPAPVLIGRGILSPFLGDSPETAVDWIWPFLLIAWGALLAFVLRAAIREPSPKEVQRAVKLAIVGIVVFDALVAYLAHGPAALLLLLLLVPATVLSRWIAMT